MTNWKASDLNNKPGIKNIMIGGKKVGSVKQCHTNELDPIEGTRLILTDNIKGLNGPDGLIREHWTKAIKKTEYLQWIFKEQTKDKYLGKVTIEYHRHVVNLMDWDNAGASFKHIGDSLVKSGIITDDSPLVIITFTTKQTKVMHYADEFIEIIIKPYADEL